MTVTLALAGDTMLGRGVAQALASTPPQTLIAPEVHAALDQPTAPSTKATITSSTAPDQRSRIAAALEGQPAKVRD